MKKFYVFIMIALLMFLTVKAGIKIMKNNKKWQVEILEDYINVRTKPTVASEAVAKAIKGDKYYVIDVNLDDVNYVWYEINYKGDNHWIASDREIPYVRELHNPKYKNSANVEYKKPVILDLEEEYVVKDLASIKYDHFEVKDDSDYKITHEVFYEDKSEETGRPQFWIRYKVTDEYGNQNMKTQKIKFYVVPGKDEVKGIYELKYGKQGPSCTFNKKKGLVCQE